MPVTNWKAQVYNNIQSLLFNNPHRTVHFVVREEDGSTRERSDSPAPVVRLFETETPPERTCLQTLQFVHHMIIPPGGRHVRELHTHPDAEELVVIMEGAGRMTIGEEVTQVTRGDVIYIPPDVEHELFNDSEALLTCLFINAPVGDALGKLQELQR
jgi:mannose-6-phosphate isomerase-like protein (cupin superfamily)